jgi:FlaA1/EpsC-like NDP-sugar epimerase
VKPENNFENEQLKDDVRGKWSLRFKTFKNQLPKTLALMFLDIIIISGSIFSAIWIRSSIDPVDIQEYLIQPLYDRAIINIIGTIVIFWFFRLYTTLWRYASIKELTYIVLACFSSLIFNVLLFFDYSNIGFTFIVFRAYFVIFAATLFLLTCLIRFSHRIFRLLRSGRVQGSKARNTMIIGAGEACNVIMKELELSTELEARICCIIDDNEQKHGTFIHGVKIVGGREQILKAAKKYNINEVIFAIPSMPRKEKSEILEICQQIPDCETKVLPGVYQLVRGEVSVSQLKNIELEDLLGREPVEVITDKISGYVSGKTVLVTGGGGSIGSELCRQIAANGVGQLIIFDVYENNAYEIQQELMIKHPDLDLVVLIGSVRNGRKLNNVFGKYKPDIVYHAAAHKHVPLMESSPNEAIKNNVFGTYKTALYADIHKVGKFVLISSDKAVNPTNVMGASKRICEMVVQMFSNRSKTEFVAVRFGNVLGSNGSVIPHFRKQIEAGGPVTVTDPEIIRYFMTIPEAVSLVLQAGASAKGGEIFVLDMGQPLKINDLARNLIKLSGYTPDVDIEIKYIGLRPGEKLYEELLMKEEGLESTENELIYIGKPIRLNQVKFLKDLEVLYEASYKETENIKLLIQEIVSTYQSEELNNKEKVESSEDWRKKYSDEQHVDSVNLFELD